MNKLFLLLFGVLMLLGCSKDDGKETATPPSLEVTVDPITTNFVTIRWTYTGSSNAVFRILLNGDIIEEAFYGDEYLLEISENGTYNGTIIANSANNEEVSDNFSFTTTGSGIWFGDLLIDTEEKYNNFNYIFVTGILTITNLGEHDLSNLSTLTGVKGLRIEDNQITSLQGLQNLEEIINDGFTIRNNPNLTSLCCLDRLQQFNVGSFEIDSNASMTRVDPLPMLESLAYLKIKNNPILSDLSGFSNLESINTLSVENLPGLTTLEDFSSLTTAGLIRIEQTSIPHLTGFNALTTLNSLQVVNNDQLLTINMTNIEHIEGINIQGNALLQSLDLPNASEMASDGTIYINNNASLISAHFGNPSQAYNSLQVQFSNLPNFTTLQGLQAITALGSLELINLPSLTSLSGFSGLETVRGEVRMENLQGLSSFSGLNNLTSAATDTSPTESRMYLVGLENISSLSGFDQLQTVGWLWISGNSSLVNLDGTQLQESLPNGGTLYVLSNPNLSDFCGLTNYVNEGNVQSATIQSNAYNPTLAQIGSEGECSL